MQTTLWHSMFSLYQLLHVHVPHSSGHTCLWYTKLNVCPKWMLVAMYSDNKSMLFISLDFGKWSKVYNRLSYLVLIEFWLTQKLTYHRHQLSIFQWNHCTCSRIACTSTIVHLKLFSEFVIFLPSDLYEKWKSARTKSPAWSTHDITSS